MSDINLARREPVQTRIVQRWNGREVTAPGKFDVGLVLHLDPDTLLDHEATCSSPHPYRVNAPHFFVCVDVRGIDSACWVPLFSNPGPGRRRVPGGGRDGHPKWVDSIVHWHKWQMWCASNTSVRRAAADGWDQSRPGSRNTLPAEYARDIAVSVGLLSV